MDGEEARGSDARRGEALPAWVQELNTAVWVCDMRGSVVYANARARALLDGRLEVDARACHRCVQGLSTSGEEHCVEDCSWLSSVRAGVSPEPALIRVLGFSERGRWALVLPIVLEGGTDEERRLVHCAHDLDSFVRAAEYLQRVAHRSSPHAADAATPRRPLTDREQEILELLGQDEDPFSIARLLNLSPVTVRNHVQHVLQKLRAHTVQEAVALHVLGGGPVRRRRT